jgi:predicted acyltransferase
MTHEVRTRDEGLDVLRGVVMVLMLFVNDVGGVESVPWWLKHFAPDLANGMTITDVVFPAFLFVVGMSVPVAMGRRSGREAVLRALWRTVCLLVMGVVMVNMDGWGWWPILGLMGLMLAFGSVPGWASVAMRAAGAVLLVWLIWKYPAYYPGKQFGPRWWGILGLIGWAYLVACSVWFGVRRWGDAFGVAAVGILTWLFAAAARHEFGDVLAWGPLGWVGRWVDWGSMIGTHGAVAVLGVLVGMGLRDGSAVCRALWVAAGCALAGLVMYPVFGVNKNIATPAWGMWSAGITAMGYVVVAAVLGHSTNRSLWLRQWLAGVGASALLLYLLQPLWFRVWSISGWDYGSLAPSAVLACLRAMGAAVLLSAIAWGMGGAGYRLRV